MRVSLYIPRINLSTFSWNIHLGMSGVSLFHHLGKVIEIRIPCVLDLMRADRGSCRCYTQLTLRAPHFEAQRGKCSHASSHLMEEHKKSNVTFERRVAVFMPELKCGCLVEELQDGAALQLVDCAI